MYLQININDCKLQALVLHFEKSTITLKMYIFYGWDSPVCMPSRKEVLGLSHPSRNVIDRELHGSLTMEYRCCLVRLLLFPLTKGKI